MQPERDDSFDYSVTEDDDLAILVGAFGDERVGLDLERNTQQAADAAEQGDLSAPPASLQAHLSSRREPGRSESPGTFAASSGSQDADPAILVGALGDERVGLDMRRDAAEPSADPE